MAEPFANCFTFWREGRSAFEVEVVTLDFFPGIQCENHKTHIHAFTLASGRVHIKSAFCYSSPFWSPDTRTAHWVYPSALAPGTLVVQSYTYIYIYI